MPGKLTLEQLRALVQELAGDEALAKAEYEQRRRLEQFGSIEQEEAALKGIAKQAGRDKPQRKTKGYDMER